MKRFTHILFTAATVLTASVHVGAASAEEKPFPTAFSEALYGNARFLSEFWKSKISVFDCDRGQQNCSIITSRPVQSDSTLTLEGASMAARFDRNTNQTWRICMGESFGGPPIWKDCYEINQIVTLINLLDVKTRISDLPAGATDLIRDTFNNMGKLTAKLEMLFDEKAGDQQARIQCTAAWRKCYVMMEKQGNNPSFTGTLDTGDIMTSFSSSGAGSDNHFDISEEQMNILRDAMLGRSVSYLADPPARLNPQ